MEIGQPHRGIANKRKEQANGMICNWSHEAEGGRGSLEEVH